MSLAIIGLCATAISVQHAWCISVYLRWDVGLFIERFQTVSLCALVNYGNETMGPTVPCELWMSQNSTIQTGEPTTVSSPG